MPAARLQIPYYSDFQGILRSYRPVSNLAAYFIGLQPVCSYVQVLMDVKDRLYVYDPPYSAATRFALITDSCQYRTKLSKALTTDASQLEWKTAADLKIKYGVNLRVGVVSAPLLYFGLFEWS